MLSDAHGRTHDYLRISLTDKCNLRCTYCMPATPHFMPNDMLMTAEEIAGIARTFVEAFGVRKIRLTGGEPLVRKDAGEILEALSELGTALHITTNGVLLDRYFDVLAQCGLTSLNVSLDSLSPENFTAFTRRNYFERVLRNVHTALEEGFEVKLNVVIVRGQNEDELPAFVELTRDLPLHVRFIEFMPFHTNGWEWEKVFSYAEMLERIGAVYAYAALEDLPHGTARRYFVPGFAGTFGVIASVTAPFCGDCNRIRLTADGKLRNCLFGVEEWDLLMPWREGRDIRPVVEAAIGAKAAERGGLPQFRDQERLLRNISGREMVRIGG